MVTTLNKIVALFLVGGFLLALLLALHWSDLKPLLVASGAGKASGVWVLVAFLSVPISAALGAVVEGVSEASFQRFLKNRRYSERFAWWMRRSIAQQDFKYWTQKAEELLGRSRKYKDLNEGDRRHHPQSLSAGIFLHSSSAENFGWLVRHYALFVMASDMVVALAVALIYFLVACALGYFGAWWQPMVPAGVAELCALLLGGVLVFWALCSLAFGRYLYSHNITTREACLFLIEKGDLEEVSVAIDDEAEPAGSDLA